MGIGKFTLFELLLPRKVKYDSLTDTLLHLIQTTQPISIKVKMLIVHGPVRDSTQR